MERGGIILTMSFHLTQFKRNHTSQKNGSLCYISHRHHHHRHPGEGPPSTPRLPPQLLYSHHYSKKNTDYLGEPLETPSAMNITVQRTRPMERIRRRCLKSQSLSQVTPYLNQARQTSFQLMGKGDVIKTEGS